MSARGWAAFAAMSVLWGVSYLFIKVAVDGGLPPAFVRGEGRGEAVTAVCSCLMSGPP